MTSNSDYPRLLEGKGEVEGETTAANSRETVEDEAEEPPSAQPVHRKAEDSPTEKAVQEGRSEKQPDISSKPLDPRDDTQPRQQDKSPATEIPSESEPQGEKPERPSPPPPSGFTGGDRKDKVMVSLPWWAGAFGAVADMGDSPEARGFYARRFCEIFFPDNTVGATEVGGVISRVGVAQSVFSSRHVRLKLNARTAAVRLGYEMPKA